MNCPACREPMIVLEARQVEVDHCLVCGGIWFDAGEIELLLEGVFAMDQLLASFQVVESGGEKPRKCPICLKKMEKIFCCGDRQLIIDRCRDFDGIWLDKGELEQIIARGAFDDKGKVLSYLSQLFFTGDGSSR